MDLSFLYHLSHTVLISFLFLIFIIYFLYLPFLISIFFIIFLHQSYLSCIFLIYFLYLPYIFLIYYLILSLLCKTKVGRLMMTRDSTKTAHIAIGRPFDIQIIRMYTFLRREKRNFQRV